MDSEKQLDQPDSQIKKSILQINDNSDLYSILGQIFENKNQEQVETPQFEDSEIVILIYFSAHWCEPCRAFTPDLAKFYREANKEKKQMEIIFVSLDISEEQYYQAMKYSPWLSIPYRCSQQRDRLKHLYQWLTNKDLSYEKMVGMMYISMGKIQEAAWKIGKNAFRALDLLIRLSLNSYLNQQVLALENINKYIGNKFLDKDGQEQCFDFNDQNFKSFIYFDQTEDLSLELEMILKSFMGKNPEEFRIFFINNLININEEQEQIIRNQLEKIPNTYYVLLKDEEQLRDLISKYELKSPAFKMISKYGVEIADFSDIFINIQKRVQIYKYKMPEEKFKELFENLEQDLKPFTQQIVHLQKEKYEMSDMCEVYESNQQELKEETDNESSEDL